ncbi:MAG: hypothetical protein L0241_03520, partial [Planctomycetia bacterium]|nr:hypothetical protein [Planctomycetia bacterium]
MHRVMWVVVLGLVAALPAVGRENPKVRRPPPVIEDVIQPNAPALPTGDANYKPPKLDGPVVELLDEGVEPIFPVLNNDWNGENNPITREDRDVFAGVEAIRVTPGQRFRSTIPGWNFKIVEKPKAPPGAKAPAEIRYLRFAWKKLGGTGVMIQLYDPVKTWAFRYFAGRNVNGWQPAKSISNKLPAEWEVVTVDLFKEFGAFTITGIALTPFDGTAGLFDHFVLARTKEDLDKHTDTALGRMKPAKPLAGKERDDLWTNLMGSDRVKAAEALRAFLASAPDQVAFVRDQLTKTALDKDLLVRIRKLLADLDDDSFDVRDSATDELIKIGGPAMDAVQALAKNPPNDEVSYRAKLILRKLNG